MDMPSLSILIIVAALSAFAHALPLLTRPDIFFGVTVDSAFRNTDEARRLLRRYRWAILVGALAAGAVALALHRPWVALMLDVVAITGAQLAAHRRVLPHAAARATTIDIDLSAPREQLPGGLVTATLPLLALLGLGGWAVPHWEQLPSRLPVHWGFFGPNRWVVASPRVILVLLALHALLCLVLLGCACGVLHWSRRISASGPAAAAERRFRLRTVSLILVVEYFAALPPLFSLLGAPPLAMQVWSAALLVILAAFVVSLMRAGQGGAREVTGSGRPVGDRTPDARWIGGMLYYNRTDPALFVEKRVGIGWTLNVGNPWAWVVLIALTALLVAAPLTVRGGLPWNGGMWSRPSGTVGALQNAGASPGTEESLRRYILSVEQGQPNYDEMASPLAAAVRRQLPTITKMLDDLGPFDGLTYQGIDANGADVYIAAFARGRLECHVGPLLDGKVVYRHLRRMT